MYFFISLKQIIIMFILMGIGFLCRYTNLMHDQTNKELTKILLYVVSPCIIINSFLQPATTELLSGFFWGMVATTIVFISSIIVAHFLFDLPFFRKKPQVNAMKFAATYSNGGFMGIPLIQAMMGKPGTFFSVPYLVIYNVFLWSHGVGIFEKRKKRVVIDQIRTIIFNPNIIATVIGFIIFVTGLHIPDIVTKPIKDIVNVNTPLSMIVIGANLGDINLDIIRNKNIWFICLVRNLLFPAITLLLLKLLPLTDTAYLAIVIMASCPIAGLIVMLSLMNNQSLDFPSKSLCLSTLLSVITLPIIIMLASVLI